MPQIQTDAWLQQQTGYVTQSGQGSILDFQVEFRLALGFLEAARYKMFQKAT